MTEGLVSANFLFAAFSIMAAIATACLVVFLTNFFFDIYGLVRPIDGRKLPVFYKEKISKFLFTQRYIPENYDTVILGTSLSDNLDVSVCSQYSGFKAYNASIMGVDIDVVIRMAENLIKGGVRNMIISVSPYMMKRSNGNGLYTGSNFKLFLPGTFFLYQTYLVALVRWLKLMPVKFPADQYTGDGVHNYYHTFKVKDIQRKIQEVIDDNISKPIVKDRDSLERFDVLVQLLRRGKVNFLVYFHPLPLPIFESKYSEYIEFHALIRSFVNEEQRVIDFNDDEFLWFTTDLSNYLDHGHLSQKGQATICEYLFKALEARGTASASVSGACARTNTTLTKEPI